MKKHALLAFVAFVSLISTQAFAADAPKVEEALTQWIAAAESGSAEKMVALYDDHAYMLPTFGTTPLRTQKERLRYYKVVLANPDRKIELVESNPHVYGKIATNSGLYNYNYSEEGQDITVQARFTFVYELRGSKWVIIEHHASQAPGTK